MRQQILVVLFFAMIININKGGNKMVSCRTLTCVNLVPAEQCYCNPCGGLERAKAEGLLDPKPAKPSREERERGGQGQFFKDKPNGQAVPVGQGLAKGRDPFTAELLRAKKRKKHAEKEAKRDAARKVRCPKKKKGDKNDKNKKKKGRQEKKEMKKAAGC